MGSTRISARTCAHPSPLKHADERRRYVPIARAISKFCHGEGATLVRIARRDRIHSRRVGPAPRGPPATSVGFRLIDDELRAIDGVRRARFRRDATGCDRVCDPRDARGRPRSVSAPRDRPRDVVATPPAPHPPVDRSPCPSSVRVRGTAVFFPGFAGPEGPSRFAVERDWSITRSVGGVYYVSPPRSRARIALKPAAAPPRARSRITLGPENPTSLRVREELPTELLFPPHFVAGNASRHHG